MPNDNEEQRQTITKKIQKPNKTYIRPSKYALAKATMDGAIKQQKLRQQAIKLKKLQQKSSRQTGGQIGASNQNDSGTTKFEQQLAIMRAEYHASKSKPKHEDRESNCSKMDVEQDDYYQSSYTASSQDELDVIELARTNSANFYKDTTQFKPLAFGMRKTTDGKAHHVTPQSEVVKILVFSRESGDNFSQNYIQNVVKQGDNVYQGNQLGAKTIPGDQKKILMANTTRAMDRVETMTNALSQSITKKQCPHVIVLIEGQHDENWVDKNTTTEPDKGIVILTHNNKKIQYKIALRVQGVTMRKSGPVNDAKRNFVGLVRIDMMGVYKLTHVNIPATTANKVVKQPPGAYDDISCVSVQYKCVGTLPYETLIVHIPNKNLQQTEKNNTYDTATNNSLWTSREQERENSEKQTLYITDMVLAQYAADRLRDNGVVVTSYMGDTNYKYALSTHSMPSTGGQSGSNFLSFVSNSDLKKQKTFMQCIAIAPSDPTHDYSVLQPSNTHLINYKGNIGNKRKTGVDHPSFIGYIAHRTRLLGRRTGLTENQTAEQERRRSMMQTHI